MNELNQTSTNFKWPAKSWIVFLEITFLTWCILVGILAATTILIVLIDLWQGLDIITALTRHPLVGWTGLAVLILAYWKGRLKGVKPTPETVVDENILRHFSAEGRRIFWQALKYWQPNRGRSFSVLHLIRALAWHKGLNFTLARLNIDYSELKYILEDADDPVTIIRSALSYAVSEKSRVSWDDLLRGIMTDSKAFSRLLEARKIKPAEAVAVVEWTRRDIYRKRPRIRHGLLYDILTPKRNINRSWSARPTPTLDRFSQNLTELAKVGMLTSAKVRQAEVEEAINLLSRSEGNNVVLVGETGVGKTSIVGDIALKLVQGKIPALSDYKLVALDVGAMAGSSVGLQQLFAQATNEAAASGNTILFIGNLDQFTKTKTDEGFDLSGILISALEKGGLQLVATSDPLNYKKYIETNENLATLFARVNVEELDKDKAVLVLEDLAHKVENRNRVLVTLEAIKAAVEMSQKYIHTGKLPDKAFDLLDAAAISTSTHNRRRVTQEDIEEVVSRKTKMPVGEITESEKEKLSGLKEKIQEGFIGQEEALDAVVEALKRARLGVSERNRPIGNFLFLGPTGVGKTELSKRLADAYFGAEGKMIRLDMSEYQTKESSYRLFGAPATAGDVALAGGSLTEQVKSMPFAVLLLDEIEKAHPDILNVFLQVLDEGRMTDNLGNTIDFTHTIIIATSNAQARFIQDAVSQNTPYEAMKEQLLKLLIQESFRPEFINRFDGVIIFRPLSMDEIEAIAHIKVRQLTKHMLETKGITLRITDEAVKELARKGYDPALGARPLERVIRDRIETKVANVMLEDSNVKEMAIDVADLG